MTEYEEQAAEFMKKTGTTFVCEFLECRKYFPSDEQMRDVYNITLTCNCYFCNIE